MAAAYRGEVQVKGAMLRGWLANVAAPMERVAFALVIDGEERGSYVADQPHSRLERYTAFGDGAHGFALQMDRTWITGAAQTVRLVAGESDVAAELHAPLGPAAHKYFDDGAVARGEAAPAQRELSELRRRRRAAVSADERTQAERQYIDALSRLSINTGGEGAARYAVLLARELHDAGRHAESLAAAQQALAIEPENFRALVAVGRSLLALNRAHEAVVPLERALVLDPASTTATLYARTAAMLADAESPPPPATIGFVTLDPHGRPAALADDLAAYLRGLHDDWICFAPDHAATLDTARAQAVIDRPAMRHVGCVRIDENTLWRRDALAGLAESGLLADLAYASLARWEQHFVADRGARTRTVALMSRMGTVMYGGVEHFLADAATHYAALGYAPVVVGAHPERAGERGAGFAFIGDTAAELRRYFLDQDVALVHVISGLGFETAEALRFTNIPFVYGVHFWRDMLGDATGAHHFDDAGVPQPRAEFALILSRAAAVYANSEYTQSIVEGCFGVRCPVVNSVPCEFA